MPNYVILDTSIYRELGLKFFENLDYLNLSGFTIATDCELLISSIVKEEFLHFYKTSLIKKAQDYFNSVNALRRDPHFKGEHLTFAEINRTIALSLDEFEAKISSIPRHNSPFAELRHTQVDALQLTKFLLEVKNQGINNIQVRDYLIWDSILKIAREESIDRVEKFGKTKVRFEKGKVYFITKDKIFAENELFQRRLKDYKLNNIEIFSSIPNFLHEKGFNVPFLSPELILAKIKTEKILRDLNTDIGALLSYINSSYTIDECDDRKVINAEVLKKEIVEFYSYKDTVDENFKFVVHLKVYVNVIFERQEKDSDLPTDSYGLNTFDIEGRPYFNAPILFIYRGLLNMKSTSIKSIRFIDFLPFVYL